MKDDLRNEFSAYRNEEIEKRLNQCGDFGYMVTRNEADRTDHIGIVGSMARGKGSKRREVVVTEGTMYG